MSKESELIDELIKYSRKTEEFEIIDSKDFLLLSPFNEPYWVPILWLLLILLIPIVCVFTDWTIIFKLTISAIWAISLGYKYYKTSKGNRNLAINKKYRTISLTSNNFLTKIIKKDSKLNFEEIVSIKVKQIISTSDKVGNSLVFHAVNVETEKGTETICMFNDNFIARRFAFLTRILTEN